jgi:hypothetical protein
VAEGHSNAALARSLWVTEQTVKFHLSNIYRKINVSNRTEASRWAQLHDILSESRRPESTEAAAEPHGGSTPDVVGHELQLASGARPSGTGSRGRVATIARPVRKHGRT